jgi:hypothetical protein
MLSTPMTSRRRMPMASSSSARRCGGRSRSGACRPPPSRGQALEPVNRLAVALAVRVVHRGEQVRRPRQLELHDSQREAGMTLEHAGEDQIAQRQRRIERLCRAAAGVAQCLVANPRILPCRRVTVCKLSGRSSTARRPRTAPTRVGRSAGTRVDIR